VIVRETLAGGARVTVIVKVFIDSEPEITLPEESAIATRAMSEYDLAEENWRVNVKESEPEPDMTYAQYAAFEGCPVTAADMQVFLEDCAVPVAVVTVARSSIAASTTYPLYPPL
jgi:hypothetical protein